MKFKTLYIAIIVFLMGLSACSDALDMAPDGKLTVDDVFADEVKVEAFLNSIYAYIPAKGSRYFFWMRGPVVWSDEAWDTDADVETWIRSGRMYNGDASAADHPIPKVFDGGPDENYWARYWAAIRNATIFISRIDNATVSSEAKRDRLRAEAHLLRAYYYSELLKWYGAVLPIEREPYSLTQDFSQVEKASYYEVAKFIIEDCDAALSANELPWRITTGAERGRLTKAVAEAIKSKMILFAASPLNNGGNDYWQEAYQINKTSLANLRANGYELYNKVNFPQTYLSDVAFIGPDKNEYAALYNEYFNQNMSFSSNPVDKETIYQSVHGQGTLWIVDGVGAQSQYKSGSCPSQEMVDAYETIDGQPILDLANPYLDEKHLSPNYNPQNTLYDPQNPYVNRDPRFYASIYYNGSKRKCFWNFAETPESHENYPAPVGNRTRIIATWVGEPQTGISSSLRKATRTGYFLRKFLHPNVGDDNPIEGARYRLFRLGEVILNFAEAAAEAGQLTEAVAAVNEIRNRVGMPNLPSNLSQQELILRIRHERRVELAFEENRYFDVRRWTLPEGNLAKTDRWITGAEIIRNADGSYTYGRRTVREVERKCYTNKFLWVPMPLDEANRLKAITGEDWQNPGW